MLATETFSFFRAWLDDPLRVAAVMPSSTALAQLITQDVSAESGPVIELGAGTGVFSAMLLARGVSEKNLALVESGPDFVALLEVRFPGVRVCRMDAEQLREARLFPEASAGVVISGLPVISMPPRKVVAILSGAFGYLRPDGAFYQFTYGPRCPIPKALLDRLGLRAMCVGHTLRNIPPASVYRITRRKSPMLARR